MTCERLLPCAQQHSSNPSLGFRLYLRCFQACSQKCTGVQLVPRVTEEDGTHGNDDDTQSTAPETLAMTTDTVAVVPDTVQPATGNTQRTHTLITEAQAETLGEVSRPEQGRNANATKQNAVRGIGVVLSFCQGLVLFVCCCQGLVLGSCCPGLLFCVDPWWLCARAVTFSTDANTSVVFVRVSLIVDNNDHHDACYLFLKTNAPIYVFMPTFHRWMP